MNEYRMIHQGHTMTIMLADVPPESPPDVAPEPPPDPAVGSIPGPEPGRRFGSRVESKPGPVVGRQATVASEGFAQLGLCAAEFAAPALSDHDLIGEMERTAGLESSWYAHRLTVIAHLYHRPLMGSAAPPEAGSRRAPLSRDDLTAAEIAPSLRLSEDAARRLVSRAVTLTSRLPGTMALLGTGRIDAARANAVEELVGKLADWAYASVLEDDGSPARAEHAASALAAMVEARILGRAPSQRTDQLRDCTRRAIARVAPAYAASLNRTNTAGRDVFVTHRGQDEQIGFFGAHLPIVEAKACYAALDGRARALRDLGDLRTLDQLRADALVHAILSSTPLGPQTATNAAATSAPARATAASGSATSGSDALGTAAPGIAAPRSAALGTADTGGPDSGTGAAFGVRDVAHGVNAHVQVTITLETLLGLRDDPAYLSGYGTLTPDVARALAFQPGSTWRRLITDPLDGTLLDYGRTKYKPPTALADHVVARDVTCSHPGCTRPARSCDLDHLLAFPLGATCECNLRPRCRRHHRLKHETSWQVAISADPSDPDGTLITTSVTGHAYKTHRPALTEPALTEPALTEPALTEPALTEPVLTELPF